MKLLFAERLRKSYDAAPEPVRKAFDKQCALLSENLRHPSLRAKKYDESRGVLQARVNLNWRFYFTIEADTYVIIGPFLCPLQHGSLRGRSLCSRPSASAGNEPVSPNLSHKPGGLCILGCDLRHPPGADLGGQSRQPQPGTQRQPNPERLLRLRQFWSGRCRQPPPPPRIWPVMTRVAVN